MVSFRDTSSFIFFALLAVGSWYRHWCEFCCFCSVLVFQLSHSPLFAQKWWSVSGLSGRALDLRIDSGLGAPSIFTSLKPGLPGLSQRSAAACEEKKNRHWCEFELLGDILLHYQIRKYILTVKFQCHNCIQANVALVFEGKRIKETNPSEAMKVALAGSKKSPDFGSISQKWPFDPRRGQSK